MPLAASAIAKNPESASKSALVRAVETLSHRGKALRAKWEEGKKVAAVVVESAAETTVGSASFAGLYYLRRKRTLQGKRNTFDAAGKVDAYFWPGFVLAAIGCVPFMGVDQRIVPGLVGAVGKSSLAVGMVGFLDDLAAKKVAEGA